MTTQSTNIDVDVLKTTTLRTTCLNVIVTRIYFFKLPQSAMDQLPIAPHLCNLMKTMLTSLETWVTRHERIIPVLIGSLRPFLNYVVWDGETNKINDSLTALRLLNSTATKECLSLEECFRLSAVYCMSSYCQKYWEQFSAKKQAQYLAERQYYLEPVIVFWTGMVAGKPWLADQFLVRAFYWAAENNFLQALRYFWSIISQERQDTVNFRCIRAFQLAAFHGQLDCFVFLWNTSADPEIHKALVQAILCNTSDVFHAFEGVASQGNDEIVQFLFREANFEQRKIMIRGNNCRAFRLAAENGHSDIVKQFLDRSRVLNVTQSMLQSENYGALSQTIRKERSEVIKLIWRGLGELAGEREKAVRSLNSDIFRFKPDMLQLLWEDADRNVRDILMQKYILHLSLLHTQNKFQNYDKVLTTIEELKGKVPGLCLEIDDCLAVIDHMSDFMRLST